MTKMIQIQANAAIEPQSFCTAKLPGRGTGTYPRRVSQRPTTTTDLANNCIPGKATTWTKPPITRCLFHLGNPTTCFAICCSRQVPRRDPADGRNPSARCRPRADQGRCSRPGVTRQSWHHRTEGAASVERRTGVYNTSRFTLLRPQARIPTTQGWPRGLSRWDPSNVRHPHQLRVSKHHPAARERQSRTLIAKFLDGDQSQSDPVLNGNGTVKQPAMDNHSMGTVFEELVRKFNEENNEEAGEH